MRHRISTGSMPYGGLTPSPPLDSSQFAFPSPPMAYPGGRETTPLKNARTKGKGVKDKDGHKAVKATKSDNTTGNRKR